LAKAQQQPHLVVRDQIQLGNAVRVGACHPARLGLEYLHTVVVTQSEDMRPLEHVTRTGLVGRKDLTEAEWFTFGELLLGINGSAAQALVEERTPLETLASCFTRGLGRCTAPPQMSFKWWRARNPLCVRPDLEGRRSLHAQAFARGWLPYSGNTSAAQHQQQPSAPLAGLLPLALLAVLLALLIGAVARCCRRRG
jgi:hypothetical protein